MENISISHIELVGDPPYRGNFGRGRPTVSAVIVFRIGGERVRISPPSCCFYEVEPDAVAAARDWLVAELNTVEDVAVKWGCTR